MYQLDWTQVVVGILQSVISGVFVGLVIYWLDERRAKRERKLSDYRIASNWNNNEPKVSLRNFDLTKANLSGHKFIKANLEGGILANAGLWATNFNGANLRDADFRKSKLYGAKFVKVTATVANFSWAVISTRTDPDYEYLPDFSGAKLMGSKFIGTQMKGVVLKGANLQGTEFSKATVANCDFTSADSTRSNWKKVRHVENCIWKNVKGASGENFPTELWQEIRRQND